MLAGFAWLAFLLLRALRQYVGHCGYCRIALTLHLPLGLPILACLSTYGLISFRTSCNV